MKCWFGTSVSTPSRSRITMYRPRSSCTQPKFSLLVPPDAREADDVAGLDGLVHQQHEAADEIAGDGLQAEAQADAECAGEHRERAQVEPERLMPSRMPKTIRKVENFEMPMRVETARPDSFISRRSIQRASQLATSRKPRDDHERLSSDQRLRRVLALGQSNAVRACSDRPRTSRTA